MNSIDDESNRKGYLGTPIGTPVGLLLGILCILVVNKAVQCRKKQVIIYKRVTTDIERTPTSRVSVLVTGGCGALGKQLLRNLVEDGGYTVHCLDVRIPDEADRIPGVSSFISADITMVEDVNLAIKETTPEAVFHVAALIPRVDTSDSDIHQVNHRGTEFIVNACKRMGVSRLVYTSSYSVIFSCQKYEKLHDVTEAYSLPQQSPNAYCESKKKGEQAVLNANGSDMVTCALRSAAIIGLDSCLWKTLIQGRTDYIGDGHMRLPLVDVNFLAQAHLLAEKKLRAEPSSIIAGKAYNIAGDSPSFKELNSYSPDPNSVKTIYGYDKPKSIPKGLVVALSWLNKGVYHLTGSVFIQGLYPSSLDFLLTSVVINSEKSRKELGLGEYPSWQETVERLVQQHKEKQQQKVLN